MLHAFRAPWTTPAPPTARGSFHQATAYVCPRRGRSNTHLPAGAFIRHDHTHYYPRPRRASRLAPLGPGEPIPAGACREGFERGFEPSSTTVCWAERGERERERARARVHRVRDCACPGGKGDRAAPPAPGVCLKKPFGTPHYWGQSPWREPVGGSRGPPSGGKPRSPWEAAPLAGNAPLIVHPRVSSLSIFPFIRAHRRTHSPRGGRGRGGGREREGGGRESRVGPGSAPPTPSWHSPHPPTHLPHRTAPPSCTRTARSGFIHRHCPSTEGTGEESARQPGSLGSPSLGEKLPTREPPQSGPRP